MTRRWHGRATATSCSPAVHPCRGIPRPSCDGTSAQVLAQVYEGLTVLDAGSVVRPALAESWSPGGRRPTHRVRAARRPHASATARPSSAEDVRRSWLRVIDPADPSPLSSVLDDVAGAAAYSRGIGSAEDVGLRCRGPLPARGLRAAVVLLPGHRGGAHAGGRASRHRVARGRTGRRGSRSPPPERTFRSTQELGQLRLRANERYWAGAPAIDRITIVTDDGGRSNVDVFEDGAVDWTPIPPSDSSWIRYDRRLGPQLRHSEDMAVGFLGFDTTEPPFDDAGVRRAVAMAVDWRRLAGLDGEGDPPPTSIVPPGIAAARRRRLPAALRSRRRRARSWPRPATPVGPDCRRSRWRPTVSVRQPPSPRSSSVSWASR